MKRSFIIGSLPVIGIFLIFVSGCASTGSLAKQQADLPKEQVNAQALFNENCATCHGKNGTADTFHGWLVGAQDLTDNQWQAMTSDEEIVHAIKTGPSAMPAFENKLSGAEIEALAAYVRTFMH